MSEEAEPAGGDSAMDQDSDTKAKMSAEQENGVQTNDSDISPKADGEIMESAEKPDEGSIKPEKEDNVVDDDKTQVQVSGPPPDYSIQKAELQPLLSQKLRKGDEWYLVDQRWLKQWKKYAGYDSWDQYHAGKDSIHPGPVDNTNMFEDSTDECLKEHLMEELDYALLPKAAWDKLTSWYSLTPGSRPICRHVVEYGTYVKHLKVEVYLFNLKVCLHPHVNEDKPAQFSRADPVETVQGKIKVMFDVANDAEVRLWQRYMSNSYELIKDTTQTLADVGIYGGQMLMLELKNKEGKWPRDSSSSQYTSSSPSYGSTTGTSSSYSGGSSYSYYDRRQEPTVPGLCGLSNLGNTCFMNSALQCLSNTQSLTEYFMGKEGAEKPYTKHINLDNPLGMKGALAKSYGDLLENMWSGDNSYLAPRQFKMMIGKHAPQFSGYQQHDSHELLAFLLDGLHEDLNLVKKKPYVDMDMKTEGREDKDIAEETWHKYLRRNQSVIVRLFQGQLKSTLICPKCNKMSRIFDPFMYLSLPLPVQKTRDMFVYLVRADPTSGTVRHRLTVPKNGSVLELKQAMQNVAGIDPKNLVVIDVYNSRFHRVYYDKDQISQIMDRDDIYLYELATPLGDTDWVPIPVYMREMKVQKSYSYFSSKANYSSYGQVFGLPIVVTVPRDGCTYRQLYNILLAQTRRYVTVPTEEKTNGETPVESPSNEDTPISNSTNLEEMDVQQTSEPEPPVNNTESTAEQREVSNSEEPMDTAEEEEGKEKEGKEEKQKEVEEDEENKDTENKEKEEEEEEEEAVVESNGDLFTLSIVNSYGSQEVKKLKDGDNLLKLTSQTYVSCDWRLESKDKFYDVRKAEEFCEDNSCDKVTEKKKGITIYDCLDLFAQKEQLGQDDAWYCPQCKDFVEAYKKFDVWKLPDILVIHLKRFSYSRYWRNKIEAKVDFPSTGLNLSNYVVNQDHDRPVYDLFGVSNHFGGMGGGHYTAYCKNKDTQKWYSFDDSHVSEADVNSVCTSSSYLLFYSRQSDGRDTRKRGVDRSLSVSFDDELEEGSQKFRERHDSQSMETDNNRIEEENSEEVCNDEDRQD